MPSQIIYQQKPECLNIEQLFDFRFRKITNWSCERFTLKNSKFFSNNLINKFNEYVDASFSYITGKQLSVTSKKYKISTYMIKNFTKDIVLRKSMSLLLKSYFGYLDNELGLEYLKGKIRIYYNDNGKLPLLKEMKDNHTIASAIYEGRLQKFNIHSWNDMINITFGNKQIKIWEKEKLESKFKKAINDLKIFYKNYKKLPIGTDREVSWINRLIQRNKFSKYGINTWNDMLYHVYGEVNIEFKRYDLIENNLEYTKTMIINFYNNNKKIPTVKDFPTLSNFIHRGGFKSYDINTWNDLIFKMFDKVNRRTNIYTGKEGLMYAVEILKEFKIKNRKKPTSKDKGMTAIETAIYRKRWKKYGINSWNDIMLKAFGEINSHPRKNEKYFGKEGLNLAINELNRFYNLHSRLPKKKDAPKILYRIRIGTWKEFGIVTWNDLLLHVFGKVNRRSNKVKKS